MNITELREKLSKVDLLSAYPFINGYGISTKTNKETGNDELVVEFKVTNKICSSIISQDYILPKTLSAYGINIKTKVTGNLQPSTDCVNKKSEIIDYIKKITHEDAYSQVDELEFTWDGMNDPNTEYFTPAGVNYFNTQLVIDTNWQKARPLSGGCSSIFYNNGTDASDATLGLLVRDKQDRSIVALSNSHVYSTVLLIGEEAAKHGSQNNMLTLSARQPADNKFGNINPEVDHIGTPKRTSYLSKDNQASNYTDAAIVELSASVIDESSNSVILFEEKGPYQFATAEEIYSLVDPGSINYQAPVFRSGRTLGALGYPGNLNNTSVTISNNSYEEPVNLTPFLSTINGDNIFNEGLSSIRVGIGGRGEKKYTFYQSSDRTKVYITGARRGTSFELFPNLSSTAKEKDLELAIEDNNKIKIFNIMGDMAGAYYVNDNNQIFISGNPPNYQYYGIYDNIKEAYNPGAPYYRTPWTELVLNNTDITTPGIKKVHFDAKVSYILTNNNKLFVRGGNFLFRNENYYIDNPVLSGISLGNSYQFDIRNGANATGYGNEGDVYTTFTQIPGEWLDFATFDNSSSSSNIVLAISGNNRLCAAYHHIVDTDESEFSANNRATGPWLRALNGGLYDEDYDILFNDYTNIYDAARVELNRITSTYYLSSVASFDFTDNVIPITVDGSEVFVKEILTLEKNIGTLPGIPKSNSPTLYEFWDIPEEEREPGGPTQTRSRWTNAITGNFINLITVDNKLLNLYGKRKIADITGLPVSDNNAVYIKHNDEPVIWNETCKKINSAGSANFYCMNSFFISGGEIFMYGVRNENYLNRGPNIFGNIPNQWAQAHKFGQNTQYPLTGVLIEKYPPNQPRPEADGSNGGYSPVGLHLSFFNGASAFKYDNFPNFNFVSGFINLRDQEYSDAYTSSIVYSDSNGVSAIGQSYNDQHNTSDTTYYSDIIVDGVDITVNVNFGNSNVITVKNNFAIKSKFDRFPVTKGGDSGTSVFALLSASVPTLSTWKCLGLIYAGGTPTNNAPGYCIPINNVVNELDIEPWEGDI